MLHKKSMSAQRAKNILLHIVDKKNTKINLNIFNDTLSLDFYCNTSIPLCIFRSCNLTSDPGVGLIL